MSTLPVRLLLTAFAGATLCAVPCGLAYALIAGVGSFDSGLAFLFGLPAGATAGALIGASISLHAHRARVESRHGEGSAPIADRLGPSLLLVAAFVVTVPMLCLWLMT